MSETYTTFFLDKKEIWLSQPSKSKFEGNNGAAPVATHKSWTSEEYFDLINEGIKLAEDSEE